MVDSEPGQGTTFKLLFPAVPAEPESLSDLPRAFKTGSETILVIEDDPGLRDGIHRLLQRHGYSVLTASNGSEGLSTARARSAHIDLVLTDLVMPAMSGLEFAAKFELEHPQVPVLFMSAYADRLGRLGLARRAYLLKPFTGETLLHRVRLELTK